MAAAQYAPPLSKLIKEMKYHSVIGAGKVCGQLLYNSVNIPTVDYIAAVPLHKKRQQERGFNQAEVMALELSRLTKLPYKRLLVRTLHTPPQAQIHDRQERLQRLQGIFTCNPQLINLQTYKNKTCLLIDDVTTTGTTLNECARVLKQTLQFKKVIGLTVAHGA